jgi:hypothetical protein
LFPQLSGYQLEYLLILNEISRRGDQERISRPNDDPHDIRCDC